MGALGTFGTPRPQQPAPFPAEVESSIIAVQRILPGWCSVPARSQAGSWAANTVYYLPVRVPAGDAPVPVDALVYGPLNIGSSTNPQTVYGGVYGVDPNTMQPTKLLEKAATVTINAGGSWVASMRTLTLRPGVWYMASWVSTGSLAGDWAQPVLPGWSSSWSVSGGVPGLYPTTASYTAAELPVTAIKWTVGIGGTNSAAQPMAVHLRPAQGWRQP